MRFNFRLRSLLLAHIVIAVYLAGYRGLLAPSIVIDESTGGVGIGHRKPSFRFASPLFEVVYLPVKVIDQHLRPDYWNRYSTLDDIRTTKDFPWGYVEVVNGCETSLCLYAHTGKDVTDAISVLRDSQDVTVIRVNGLQFTDADFETLHRIRTFNSIELLATSVTRATVQDFRSRSPNTRVTWISASNNKAY